jgi:hypothetical protein
MARVWCISLLNEVANINSKTLTMNFNSTLHHYISLLPYGVSLVYSTIDTNKIQDQGR